MIRSRYSQESTIRKETIVLRKNKRLLVKNKDRVTSMTYLAWTSRQILHSLRTHKEIKVSLKILSWIWTRQMFLRWKSQILLGNFLMKMTYCRTLWQAIWVNNKIKGNKIMAFSLFHRVKHKQFLARIKPKDMAVFQISSKMCFLRAMWILRRVR